MLWILLGLCGSGCAVAISPTSEPAEHDAGGYVPPEHDAGGYVPPEHDAGGGIVFGAALDTGAYVPPDAGAYVPPEPVSDAAPDQEIKTDAGTYVPPDAAPCVPQNVFPSRWDCGGYRSGFAYDGCGTGGKHLVFCDVNALNYGQPENCVWSPYVDPSCVGGSVVYCKQARGSYLAPSSCVWQATVSGGLWCCP
jgi:hypothetical protein